MTRLTGLAVGCALVVLTATSAQAEDCRGTVTAKEAAAAEDARYAAQTKNDFAAMEKLFGPDLLYTHGTGAVDTKESYIQSMRSGALAYKSMKRSDEKIRTYGCLAIITGRADFVSSVNKAPDAPASFRFHAIYAKREGGLQFVSWQSTRLTTP